MTYTDTTPMPFGVHKGTKLANVPAKYLIWLSGQEWFQKSTLPSNTALRNYINENKAVLSKEAGRDRR